MTVELTAGIDSRAILAILLSVFKNTQIIAQTGGMPHDFEVILAKRLAEKYEFEHKVSSPTAEKPEEFLSHARLFAFVTNGMENSKRATNGLPSYKAGRC